MDTALNGIYPEQQILLEKNERRKRCAKRGLRHQKMKKQ
jgi:hypothetical protein